MRIYLATVTLFLVAGSGAYAQVPLTSYAGANGMIDVQKFIPKLAIGLVAILTLTACNTVNQESTLAAAVPSTSERPANVRSEALIGRWGVASFRQEKDRQRVVAQARSQCKLPYTIAKGPTGGVMMHVADDPTLYELRPKGGSDGKTYLGFEAPPGHPQDREIISISDREIVMRFVDPDASNRYGTFVYMRCTA